MLRASAGKLKTSMGACYPGSHAVFRGHDLHADLRHMDWIELFVFGITGRRFTPAQIRLLHALWVHTSYPDARLWNNRVAALAASARSTPVLGISAALAVSEAVIYGGYPFVRAIDFLQQARTRTENGERLEDILQQELEKRRIYGYGRPINSVDERLPWTLALARELELDRGPHLRIALETERILVAHNPVLRMNYAAMAAALAADLGFSPQEFHHFQIPIFMAGMNPCFIDAAKRPEGSLFPLSCDDIVYEGKPERSWPSRR
jgi:citrate synthase